MDEKYENYIKDLSPELQEKARACKSLEELAELAAENDAELPEDALEMVAGGCSKKGCNHSYILVERAKYTNRHNKHPGNYWYDRYKCCYCGAEYYHYEYSSFDSDRSPSYETYLTKSQFDARYDPVSGTNITDNVYEYSLTFYMNNG